MTFVVMAQVHIGKKIKEVFKQSGLKGTEFASLINRDRQVIYNIFKRDTIDTGDLQKISKVLEHDFFSYYSYELPIVKEPGKVGYTKKVDLITSLGEELKAFKKRLAEMEEKYETLQKLNRLQEEKLERLKKKSTK
ncbi:MAG: helix-turn-helix domain-containing protein [Bacteroidia bacterium]